MEDPWSSPIRKLDRAATHFEALHDEVATYVKDGTPFDLQAKIDNQRSLLSVEVIGGIPPPEQASLIVGDFVQNLRASLDHVVCAAAEVNGNTSTMSNAFPISLRPPEATRRDTDRWAASTGRALSRSNRLN
jgi:hypothetical protein